MIITCESEEVIWGKSLAELPMITIKEIEAHRLLSGKGSGVPMIKTLERGRNSEKNDILRPTLFSPLFCHRSSL